MNDWLAGYRSSIHRPGFGFRVWHSQTSERPPGFVWTVQTSASDSWSAQSNAVDGWVTLGHELLTEAGERILTEAGETLHTESLNEETDTWTTQPKLEDEL